MIEAEGIVTQMAAPIRSGDPELVPVALETEAPRLVELHGRLHAVVHVPLQTAGRTVGALVAVETVPDETLAAWSSLCGAELSLDADGAEQEFLAEEEALRTMKHSLRRLEEEMLKRLLQIHRGRLE